MPLLARLTVICAALLAATVMPQPASAATMSLTPSAPTVLDVPNDGVIAAGDTLSITEPVTNGGAAVTGLQATLTSSTPGVQVVPGFGSSSYPDLGSGASGANTSPFKVTLDQSLPCGTILSFSLSFTSGGGDTATVAFTIASGVPSTTAQDHSGNATLIGDATPTLRPRLGPTTYSASALVTGAGIVKGVKVTIGSLTHENIGHLKLTIVAPSGARATLVDHRGSAGGSFTDTELVRSSPNTLDPPGASSPYTGTFQADGDLGALVGVSQQGTWHLNIDADDPNELGRLDSWTLSITTADCSPQSYAKLQVPPLSAPGGPVTLDASGSHTVDPGGITKYEWDLGNGTFTQETTTSTLTSTFARGHYTVRVRVSDARGPISTATATLIVSQAPTATITPFADPKQGIDVALDGSSSSDPDGPALVGYEWDLDYDGATFHSDATGAQPMVNFATAGPHTVALRVTDVDGATAIASTATTVIPTHAPTAVATASPNPVIAGTPVSFDASGSSDSDGTVTAYAWDLDGNGTFETVGGASPVAARSYPNPGVVSVGLRVTDNDGKSTVTHIAVLVLAPTGGGSSAGGSAGGGSAAGSGGTTGGGGGGDGAATGKLVATLDGASIQPLKLVTKKGLGLRCIADRAATCSVTATLKAVDARRLGLSRSKKKTYVLGRATVRLTKRGAATVAIRVARGALTKLKRAPRVTVLVTGTATDSGGGRATLRRAVLVRR